MHPSHPDLASDGTANVSPAAESPLTTNIAGAKPEPTPRMSGEAATVVTATSCGPPAPPRPSRGRPSLDGSVPGSLPLRQYQDLNEDQEEDHGPNEAPALFSCASLPSYATSQDQPGTGQGHTEVGPSLSLKDREGQDKGGEGLLMTNEVTSSSMRVVEAETPLAAYQDGILAASAPVADGRPREGNDESGREPAPISAGTSPNASPEAGPGAVTPAAIDINGTVADETVVETKTASRAPDRSPDRPPVPPMRMMEYWDPERFLPSALGVRFTKAVQAWKPALVADPALWHLFVYLCFGSYTHRDSGHLQLPIQLLAAFAGALTPAVLSCQSSRRGTQLLVRMQQVLGKDEGGEPRFSWHGARSGKNPRMMRRLHLPDEVARLVEEERLLGAASGPTDDQPETTIEGTAAIGPMVLAVRDASGAFRSDSTRARAARERHVEARARGRRSDANYGPSRDVLDHLNGLPSNAFTATIKRNLGAAFAATGAAYEQKAIEARALPERRYVDRLDHLRRARDAQRNALRELAFSAKPRYVPSPNSARLFPSESHHPAGLWSEVRRAATAPWVELDLEAAYVGSAPRIFDVPCLEDFLASGACVWDALIDDVGLGPLLDAFPERREGVWSAVKGVIKREGVYPSMTGRTQGNASRRVTEKMPLAAAAAVQLLGAAAGGVAVRLVPSDVGERLVGHPLMADLYAARTAFAERALSQGYVFDHVGRKVALPGYDGAADHVLEAARKKRTRARVVGTLTSYLFSLIEMDLMKAVLDLEREQGGAQGGARFRTMLWQHDGASVMLLGSGRLCTACTVAEIQRAVAAEAHRLGVYTRLKVDHDAEGLARSRDTCRGCTRRCGRRRGRSTVQA